MAILKFPLPNTVLEHSKHSIDISWWWCWPSPHRDLEVKQNWCCPSKSHENILPYRGVKDLRLTFVGFLKVILERNTKGCPAGTLLRSQGERRKQDWEDVCIIHLPALFLVYSWLEIMQKQWEVYEVVGRGKLPRCGKLHGTRCPHSDRKQQVTRCGQKSTQSQGSGQPLWQLHQLEQISGPSLRKVNNVMKQK